MVRQFVDDHYAPRAEVGAPQGALSEPRSTHDMGLAFRAALETRITGRIPPPEETAGKSLPWLKDVSLQLEWIEFYEQPYKRQEEGGKDPFGRSNGHRP